MGQVPAAVAGTPAHHLLIGNGKLSRHFAKYFTDLNLSVEFWPTPREFPAEFFRAFRATHVWILVSDRAIEAVAERLRVGLAEFGASASSDGHLFLHASGASVVPGVLGAHPLMTFGEAFYDLETYRRVPFVVEHHFDGVPAAEVLGGLPNLAVYLDPEKRALYHALVSAAGNFPALLWTEIFARFESELGLSRDLLAPFLFRTLANTLAAGEAALTGPLVRGDTTTLKSHRAALAGSTLAPLYAAFETFYESQKLGRGGESHVET